jgi:PKD repeat protein
MLSLSTTRHPERRAAPLPGAPSGLREAKAPSVNGWIFQAAVWLTALAVALAVAPPAEAANKKPVAKIAKAVPVNEGAAVTLDGSLSSDPEGGALSYAWLQTKGSPSVTINGATTSRPTLTAPPIPKTDKKTKPIKLTFQLTVTDAEGLKAAKTTVLTVNPLNTPPLAKAGADISAGLSANVTLASLSTDPDAARGGRIVKYQWTQLKKPGAPKVKLLNAKAAQVSFTSPSTPAQLEFQLTVNDNDNAKATDTVIVTVADVQPLNATFSLDKKALAPGETATAGASGITGGKGPYKVKFEWGDGSAAEEIQLTAGETSKTRSHQYANAGSFTQKVTVTDADGTQKAGPGETVTVTAPVPPALGASLSVTPTTLTAGGQLTAQATAITGGTGPYTVAFNWGDGSQVAQETLGSGVTAKSASHVYASAGTYTLTITVTDGASGSKTQTFQITVSNPQAPALGGALSLTQATVPFNTPVEAKIDITGGTGPYKVTFAWGDGQSDGPTPLNQGIASATGSHFYGLVGSYTITATITDANNATKVVTANATVSPVDAPLADCQ